MRIGYNHGAANCRRIYDHICRLTSYLQVTYFHILICNNTIASKFTNQCVKINLGIVTIKCQSNIRTHVPQKPLQYHLEGGGGGASYPPFWTPFEYSMDSFHPLWTCGPSTHVKGFYASPGILLPDVLKPIFTQVMEEPRGINTLPPNLVLHHDSKEVLYRSAGFWYST